MWSKIQNLYNFSVTLFLSFSFFLFALKEIIKKVDDEKGRIGLDGEKKGKNIAWIYADRKKGVTRAEPLIGPVHQQQEKSTEVNMLKRMCRRDEETEAL